MIYSKKMKYKKNLIVSIGILILFFCNIFKPIFIYASEYEGTIDGIYKYAKGVDDPSIKLNFGLFRGSINVKVNDEYLSGFAWGDKIGWINLSPVNGGVINNGEGILSGYATTEFGGLINFKPTGGGVMINSKGEFKGYALSEKFGKISFSCVNDNSCSIDDYKIKTDWRPKSIRKEVNPNNSTPAVIITSINTETEKKDDPDIVSTRPVPLPVVNNGQYSGGDIIKENKVTTKGELITTIRTLEDLNKNESNIDSTPDDNIISSVTPVVNTNITPINTNKSVSILIQNTAKQIKQEANIIIETPVVNISTKTVATIGIAGGSTLIVSSLTTGLLSASEFFLVFFRFWSLILAALGLRKRREPWGTVYDSITKQPLDPAYVILQDKNGEEVATSITDLDGRYGFLVPPGVYTMLAKKTNYIAPSLHLHGRNKDELYDNLYFGEEIELKKNTIINRDIPMDPQGFDWNEFAKKDKNLMKFHSPRKKLIAKISNTLFWVGLLFSICLLIAKPDIYNVGIIILYLVLSVFRFLKLKTKSFGVITDKNSGFPLSFAIIRIYSKSTHKEMFHRVADLYGHYYCLLPKGEYRIVIEKKNIDESYTNIYTLDSFISQKGILNLDFMV